MRKIDELLSYPGLPYIVGPLDQYNRSWMLDDKGRDALARYDQLQGRAFLEAYGTLRGGGAIGSMVPAYAGPVAAVVADRYAGLDDVPDLSLASFLGFMLGLAAWTMCAALLQRVGGWLDAPPRLPPSPPE